MPSIALTGPGITSFAQILAEGRQEGIIALPSLHSLNIRFNSLGDAHVLNFLTSVIHGGALPKLLNVKIDRRRRLEDFNSLKEVGKRDRPELWTNMFESY